MKSVKRFALLFGIVVATGDAFLGSPFRHALGHMTFRPTRCRQATVQDGGSGGTETRSDPIQQEPDMEAFASGYTTVFAELPFKICSASVGEIPVDLKGSYFRAGPAMFSAGSIVPPKTSIVQPKQPPVLDGKDTDRMVLHPFEGDGAVLGVTFHGDGTASARYRYVRTAAFTNERKKGQRLYKGMDTTRLLGSSAANGLGNDLPLPLFRHHLQSGLNKNRKNTSNTRTIYWAKRLFSLWEGGLPYKLDGLALSTDGRSQLGGAVKKETDSFSGKMVYDSKQERALFYGLEPGAQKSALTLYEFNADFRLVPGGRFSVDLPGFAITNDFCATENYAVFVQPNVLANGVQFTLIKEPGKVLGLDQSRPASVVLVPRPGSAQSLITVDIPRDELSDANMQMVNAYEDGDWIVFDAIRSSFSSSAASLSWPWGSTAVGYGGLSTKKSLWRYAVNMKSRTVSKTLLCNDHCLFASVNPAVSTQRHQFVFMNVGGLGPDVAPLQGIAKYHVQSGEKTVWLPQSHEFCGEPVFAQREKSSGAEDDGYLISVLYDGRQKGSEVVILRAGDITAGPIARMPLGISIPHGLFGCFTAAEEARWAADEIQRRAKLADKMESRGNRWNEVKSDFSGLGLRFDDMEEYFGDFFS